MAAIQIALMHLFSFHFTLNSPRVNGKSILTLKPMDLHPFDWDI